MPITYAVTLIWNVRPLDPQEHYEETTTILIVADSEEEAEELALASCGQEEAPDDCFAIEFAQVAYKRFGKQRDGELGLVAAY
jgi:hypothetical protein